MQMLILSMRDIKANYYSPPIFVPNLGAAMRDITDAVNDPNGKETWQKHPEDFELYQLGTWDSDTASFDIEHGGSKTEAKQLCVLSSLKQSKP